MGLDNGITVKKLHKNCIPNYVLENSRDWTKYNDDGTSEFEICYWRKYWGLRGEITALLHMDSDNYKAEIDVEDIPAILRVMKKYFNQSYFEENASTIWEYDEAIEHMINNYINLSWLYNFMKEYPDEEIQVEFYDSY